MIALLTEGKWTGNRIEFLARVRNRSIRPLFSRKEKYDKLIVMNDAIFCAEDVLRLALHECVAVCFSLQAAHGAQHTPPSHPPHSPITHTRAGTLTWRAAWTLTPPPPTAWPFTTRG